MTGLILLFVLTVWLVCCFLVALLIYKILPKRWWRLVFACVFYFALVASPLHDEILGRFEFDRLCKENSKIEFNPLTARGRTVYLAESENELIKGRWVDFSVQEWKYLDVKNHEPVLRYKDIFSGSGKLMTKFVFSDSGTPLHTIMRESCTPGKTQNPQLAIFKEYEITSVRRETQNQNERK